MKNDTLYYCDICYSERVDEDENIIKKYFNCYTNQQWANHLKSKKHMKFKNHITSGGEGVECKKCNKVFSVEGYALHKKRNEKMWTMCPEMKCNNFTTGKHRYRSFDCLIDFKTRRPQSRTPVGKISPITGMIRKPNGYKEEELVEEEEEEEIENCSKCNGCFNNTNYIDKDFIIKFNRELCSCPDELPDYSKPECEIVKGLELSIEEIEMTEKPQFDNYCDSCGLPINYDVPINIINKWEIDTCSCEETDSE